MKMRRNMIAFVASLLALAGCATVQTEQEWARLAAFAQKRVGVETRWEQTKGDAQATQAEVAAMLADGLDRQEAVRIALVNNRALQVAFEELGVAKADLVQAGFFTNPRIDGLVRFPTEGGGTNVEAGGIFNIADFWQIPVRKRLAATRLEAATLRVTDEVMKTVAEAKRAYDDAIALAAAREEAAGVLKALEALRDRIAHRMEFGYASDFDVAFARAAVFDQEAALARVEGELRVARTHLSRVLGLAPEQTGVALTGALGDEVGPLPDTDTLLAHALAHRPDVQLAELEIAISERALDLERTRVFTHVEAGAAFERELEGDNLVGPALGLQVPIFDQNQAQIAKASYRLRQARKQHQAIVGMVREEVAAAAERLAVARHDARLIRDRVLPAYQDAIGYAEKYVGAMQLNMLFLLEARKELFTNSRRYIDALREARAAQVDLERALGGALPSTETDS